MEGESQSIFECHAGSAQIAKTRERMKLERLLEMAVVGLWFAPIGAFWFWSFCPWLTNDHWQWIARTWEPIGGPYFWVTSGVLIWMLISKTHDKEKIARAFKNSMNPTLSNPILFRFTREGIGNCAPFGAQLPTIAWSDITAFRILLKKHPNNGVEPTGNMYIKLAQLEKFLDGGGLRVSHPKLYNQCYQWAAYCGGHVCLPIELAAENLNTVHEELKKHLSAEQLSQSGYFFKGKVTPIDGPIP